MHRKMGGGHVFPVSTQPPHSSHTKYSGLSRAEKGVRSRAAHLEPLHSNVGAFIRPFSWWRVCDSAQLFEGNENCQWQCACRQAGYNNNEPPSWRTVWCGGVFALANYHLPPSWWTACAHCSGSTPSKGMFTAGFSALRRSPTRIEMILSQILFSGLKFDFRVFAGPAFWPVCFIPTTYMRSADPVT